MSETDDVYAPGAVPQTETDFGTLDYGANRPLWDAMNPLAVLVAGVLLLTEAPLIGLIGGGAYWFFSFAPTLFSLPFDIALEVLAIGGSLDPNVKEGISSLGRLVITLFFWPFGVAAIAGTWNATAHYVATGEADIEQLWSAPRFISLFVFQLVTSLLTVGVLAVLLAPGGALAYGIWVSTHEILYVLLAALLWILVAWLPVMWLSLTLLPGQWIAVMDDANAIEAIGDSFASFHLGDKAVLWLSSVIFATASSIAFCFCFFPAIFVWAVWLPGQAAMWMEYSRSAESREQMAFLKDNRFPFFT